MKIKDNILREKAEHSNFAVAEAEFTMPKLIKLSDKLYVPENFDVDHSYYADETGKKRYYGITSVLSVISKGDALIQWAANMAVDHILNNSRKITTFKNEVGVEEEYTWFQHVFDPRIIPEARTAHKKKKESAGEAGTGVHAEIEAYINYCIAEGGDAVPLKASIKEEVEKQTALFADWAITNKVKFLAAEQRLYSEKLWVAGTADFVCVIDGKYMIGDVKTSNSGIYPEHMWQATAYAHMAKEMGLYEDFEGVVIVNVPKRGGIKVQYNYDLKGNFQIFKGALTVFKGLQAQKVKKLKK